MQSKEGEVVESNVFKGRLQFDNIHFRYSTWPGIHVLRGISLNVEPGIYTALVGASRSGGRRTTNGCARFLNVSSCVCIFFFFLSFIYSTKDFIK